MNNRIFKNGLAVLLFTFIGVSHSSFAQNLAIQGYSPVSYFTKGIAEKGNETYAVEHKGSVYYLSSTEQKAMFSADPESFTPRFGEYCPFSLKTGMRKAIDPESFKIVGDSLLLFHYSDELDAKSEWNKTEDGPQIDKASGEYVLFTF